jgi:hypothetical protein
MRDTAQFSTVNIGSFRCLVGLSLAGAGWSSPLGAGPSGRTNVERAAEGNVGASEQIHSRGLANLRYDARLRSRQRSGLSRAL